MPTLADLRTRALADLAEAKEAVAPLAPRLGYDPGSTAADAHAVVTAIDVEDRSFFDARLRSAQIKLVTAKASTVAALTLARNAALLGKPDPDRTERLQRAADAVDRALRQVELMAEPPFRRFGA